MVNRGGISIKGRKSICTKRWEAESRNNMVTLWYVLQLQDLRIGQVKEPCIRVKYKRTQ